MKAFIILISFLPYLSQGQKICYEPNRYHSFHSDIPCDPGAAVSACCSSGQRCATNLYCISPLGAHVVGTCTDIQFADAACPWPLNKTTASTNFDHFDYRLNTTTCPDQTICPSDDPSCCTQSRGKVEIEFHYDAAIPSPSAKAEIISYYSAATYTTINLATIKQTSSLSATTIPTASAITTTRARNLAATSGLAQSTKQSNKAIQPGVGAVIGIAIALCLSLPLAIIIYLRRCSGRRRNDLEISNYKLGAYNERVATPDEEIAAAVRIIGLNELPDIGRVMAAELDVRRQTQGGLGPTEMEGQDHTGAAGIQKV